MIKSLTSLRGIFILFIFLHHCLDMYAGGGTMAVTFFFVLGGFSMTLGYKDRVLKPDFSYREYIKKRCMKFYPLHWVTLLAAVPFVLLSFSWKQIPVFLVNASLLQTWIPVKPIYFSFNAVSWYLANTMFFAVVFPLLFKWIVRATPKRKAAISAGFVVVYALVAVFLPMEWRHAVLYISPYMRLTDFVFGIFLALGYLKLRDKTINRQTSMLYQILVIATIILLVVESCMVSESTSFIAPIYWPLVAIVIVLASLSGTAGGGYLLLENKWLQRLGELSFTIFMTHQLVLRYTTVVIEKLLHYENDIVYVIITLTLTIIVSSVVDKYILKPITQWLTKRIQPSMTARS